MGLFSKLFGGSKGATFDSSGKQVAATGTPKSKKDAVRNMDSEVKKKYNTRPAINKTVQGFIGETLQGITDSGIVASSNNTFSKLYALTDANFATETEERQKRFLDNFSNLINRFPDNIDISLVIMNERNTKEDIAKAYHFKLEGDELDAVREDYNKMIDTKIATSHTEIAKKKYILLTYHCGKELGKGTSALATAESELALAETSLIEGIKNINAKAGCKAVSGYKRLELMHKTLNGIDNGVSFEREYGRYFDPIKRDGEDTYAINPKKMKKNGQTCRNIVAPQVIGMTNQQMQLGNDRYCKSYTINNLPTTLDVNFLTRVTNFAYEMVTVIQFKTVPRKKAQTLVKMKVNDTKADLIKATQNAVKNNYSPDMIDETLKENQENAAKLRYDVIVEHKKLFFTTTSITFFGKTEDELEDLSKLFISECSNLSITPNYLLGQQKRALLTSLCCGNSTIVQDRMITSDEVKAFNPFSVQELTDKRGHFYGSNAISKNLIMYDRKRSKLANGLEFGMSGSGKSFFIKGEIIANYLDGNDKIIILDPEGEYHVVAEKFGGIVVDLSLSGQWHINPCDLSMEWATETDEGTPVCDLLAEKCDYMVSLVESIYGRGRECNVYETKAIHQATMKMYEKYVKEMTRRHEQGCEAGQSDTIDTELCPTLTDFYNCLMADGDSAATDVADKIYLYCHPNGSYNIFAHHTNVPTDSRFVVYNLLKLPTKTMEMAMKVCLTSVWKDVIKNREENEKYHTGRSVWLYLDEFHHFFKTKSSADTIMAYFKRVRKYGGVMTGITQDVNDLLNTEQGQAMYSNTGFFVFLNQSALGREKIQNLHNVSDALMEYITDQPVGKGLIYNGTVMIPFDYTIPKDTELYRIMSTNPHDEAEKKKIKEEADREFKDLAGTSPASSDEYEYASVYSGGSGDDDLEI